jgi:hypothetical protein
MELVVALLSEVSQSDPGFATENDLVFTLYRDKLETYYPLPGHYLSFITDLLGFLVKADAERVVNSGLLDFWIDKSLRLVESTLQVDEKIVAMSFLVETWFCFGSFLDSKPDLANAVLATLRKCAREKASTVSFVAVS